MNIVNNTIELIFSAALFFNALLFIPQAIRIFSEKSAKSISLITFVGFLFIQLAILGHAVIVDDHLLMWGYLVSLLTCGSVVLLSIFYKYFQKTSSTDSLTLEEIIAQLPGHVYWKDKQCTFKGSNTNNHRDFGVNNLSEFLNKTDYDLFSKAEADQLRKVDKEVMLKDKAITVEEELEVNGKKSLYLSHKAPLKNHKNEIVGLIGYSTDITQTKQEVVDSLALLDNVIAVMPGNVYWMNKQGIYLGCNDNEANAVGLNSRKDIVGKKNTDISGFVIPHVIDAVNKQVIASGEAITIEEPAVLRDGSDAVFLSNKVPLKNSRGEIAGIVGISIDITDRKKMENELLIAKEKAEVANKAKEEFLYNMRHDIRTPFSGITGMAQLLQEIETNPQKLKYIENIAVSSDQLLDYLNTILEFTQTESGSAPIVSKRIALKDHIQSCIEMFRSSSQQSQIQLCFDYDKSLLEEYFTDDFRIKRILINLIGNAVKFTPEGGEVKVLASLIERNSDTHEALVRLIVKDNGIGIPQEKQDIIFEKFERLSSSYQGKYKGTGLGLYAVKALLHDLAAVVHVESEVGQGSAFICDIPMKEPRSTEKVRFCSDNVEHSDKTTKEWLDKKSHDILLVEDGEIVQMAACSLLESLNCFVDVAETGEQALKLCEKNHYDLIFMDIGLPGMDGFEATKQIRQLATKRETAIVALTAHAEDEINQQSQEAGINTICSKPLVREKIIELFQQFFDKLF